MDCDGWCAFDRVLNVIGNFAAIVTAAVAVFAYMKYRRDRARRASALARHLKKKKQVDKSEDGVRAGQRSILNLMARLRMTEPEVIAAAYDSEDVTIRVQADGYGRARALLLEHRD